MSAASADPLSPPLAQLTGLQDHDAQAATGLLDDCAALVDRVRQPRIPHPLGKHTLPLLRSNPLAEVLTALRSRGRKFVDADFRPSQTLAPQVNGKFQRASWYRLSELVPADRRVLFSARTSWSDVVQGSIGNCYMVSLVSLLPLRRELLPRIFLHTQVYAEGVLALKVYFNACSYTVLMDDFVPVDSAAHAHLLCARSKRSELWITLLEKLFAKLAGSYADIRATSWTDVFTILTNQPASVVALHSKGRDLQSPEDRFRMVQSKLRAGSLVLTSTDLQEQRLSQVELALFGLFCHHAYSVIDIDRVVHPRTGQVTMLIHLQNPHGCNEWKGNWSDGHHLWQEHPEDAKRLHQDGARDSSDGEFWMSLNDWSWCFAKLVMCDFVSDHLPFSSLHHSRFRTELHKGIASPINPTFRVQAVGSFTNAEERFQVQVKVTAHAEQQSGVGLRITICRSRPAATDHVLPELACVVAQSGFGCAPTCILSATVSDAHCLWIVCARGRGGQTTESCDFSIHVASSTDAQVTEADLEEEARARASEAATADPSHSLASPVVAPIQARAHRTVVPSLHARSATTVLATPGPVGAERAASPSPSTNAAVAPVSSPEAQGPVTQWQGTCRELMCPACRGVVSWTAPSSYCPGTVTHCPRPGCGKPFYALPCVCGKYSFFTNASGIMVPGIPHPCAHCSGWMCAARCPTCGGPNTWRADGPKAKRPFFLDCCHCRTRFAWARCVHSSCGAVQSWSGASTPRSRCDFKCCQCRQVQTMVRCAQPSCAQVLTYDRCMAPAAPLRCSHCEEVFQCLTCHSCKEAVYRRKSVPGEAYTPGSVARCNACGSLLQHSMCPACSEPVSWSQTPFPANTNYTCTKCKHVFQPRAN